MRNENSPYVLDRLYASIPADVKTGVMERVKKRVKVVMREEVDLGYK